MFKNQNKDQETISQNTIVYQGTSEATSGWLKILAALHLMFVGIGLPAGV